MAQRKDLQTTDTLTESIALLDQVRARISQLLADLAAAKPKPAADAPAEPTAEA